MLQYKRFNKTTTRKYFYKEFEKCDKILVEFFLIIIKKTYG